MATTTVVMLGLVMLMAGTVEMARLQPGSSFHFQYDGGDYWFRIDWWGTVNFATAQSECKSKYSAGVYKVRTAAEYAEVQSQVEQKIPENWNEVMLWTDDDGSAAGTKDLLVIWRPGTGGPNGKDSQPLSYYGHGYVCYKPRDRHCYADYDCPPGYYCNLEEKRCYPVNCGSGLDCPPGYTCNTSNNMCVTVDCKNTLDCPPGFHCDPAVCYVTANKCDEDVDCPPRHYCQPSTKTCA